LGKYGNKKIFINLVKCFENFVRDLFCGAAVAQWQCDEKINEQSKDPELAHSL
jgi:hypothetical protein